MKKGQLGFWVEFALLTLLSLLLMQIHRHTWIGWVLAIVIMITYGVVRSKFFAEKALWQRLALLAVGVALYVTVFAISMPPTIQTKSVEIKNPKVTDVVTVEQGQLTGVYNNDESVAVYAGIPYAKPPVGQLRWKEPETPDNWEGVRVCDTFAPMSMQNSNSDIYDFVASIVGYGNFKITTKDDFRPAKSEDSLYLNVWAPADAKPGDDLPVMVYIHGGSLTGGQSYYQDYNGETFAKQGIVFVTIDYRLGVFGYLATEELAEESENGTTGNYGLLDQIQALKWVNENIESFGGDVSNITIAGESAGSSSVNAICVSPLAKGLFRRAIGESSGIAAVEPYHTFRSYEKALAVGDEIKKSLKCSSMNAMREVSAEKLLKYQSMNSSMTVDGYAIVEQPYLTYEKGNNNEEALLSGFNENEAYVFDMFSKMPNAKNYEEFLSKGVGEFAPEMAALLPAKTKAEAKENYNEFLGMLWFGYSHYVWSNYLTDQDKDVYLYFFNKQNGGIGTWHAGEMPYAYGNLDMKSGAYDKSDKALSDTMVQYWCNFAKTGDPNGKGLPRWSKYNNSPAEYMEFSDNVSMMKNDYVPIFKVIDMYQETLR